MYPKQKQINYGELVELTKSSSSQKTTTKTDTCTEERLLHNVLENLVLECLQSFGAARKSRETLLG